MAQYTATDLLNADKYVHEELKKVYMKKLYEKYPHLISHMKYKIRPATHNDYYFVDAFSQRAIVVEIEFTEKFCDKISCNAATNQGPCTPNTPASMFRLGDEDKFDIQCQPACFHLRSDDLVTYDPNNETPAPQMRRTIWNKGRCVLVPDIATWMECPLYRSTERYEMRVNNLPYGFNRTYNEYTAAGLNYEYNEAYCMANFDEFDPIEKNCTSTWSQTVQKALIGESLYKMFSAGMYAIENNFSIIPGKNLSPPPDIDKKWIVENWLSDIDESFKLPEQEEEPEEKTRRRRDLSEQSVLSQNKVTAQDFWSDTSEVLLGLMESTTELEFWRDFGIDLGVTGTAQIINHTTKKILERVAKNATQFIHSKASVTVLKFSITRTLTRTIAVASASVIGKMALSLSAALASLSTVVGIVFLIATILDIIFTIWDPLNFNVKYPKELLQQFMFESEAAMRKMMGTANTEVTFDMLVQMLLTDDEKITTQLTSQKFYFDYLNSLVYNSEGSVIDKDTAVIDDGGNVVNTDSIIIAQNMYTLKDFANHEKNHLKRVKLFDIYKRYTTISILCGLICLALKLNILSVIIFLVSSFLLAISYINTEYFINWQTFFN